MKTPFGTLRMEPGASCGDSDGRSCYAQRTVESLENAKVVMQGFVYDLTHPVTAGQFMGNVVILVVALAALFVGWRFLTSR